MDLEFLRPEALWRIAWVALPCLLMAVRWCAATDDDGGREYSGEVSHREQRPCDVPALPNLFFGRTPYWSRNVRGKP